MRKNVVPILLGTNTSHQKPELTRNLNGAPDRLHCPASQNQGTIVFSRSSSSLRQDPFGIWQDGCYIKSHSLRRNWRSLDSTVIAKSAGTELSSLT